MRWCLKCGTILIDKGQVYERTVVRLNPQRRRFYCYNCFWKKCKVSIQRHVDKVAREYKVIPHEIDDSLVDEHIKWLEKEGFIKILEVGEEYK